MPSAINTTPAARINLRITSQAEMLSQPEGWIWPLGHSAPRLSPVLRTPPLCRCAEYPSDQIVQANLVCEQRVHQRSLPRAMQWVA